MILDGELVHIARDGRPDCSAVRRRLGASGPDAARRAAGRIPTTLVVSDVLHLDGRDICR